MSTLIGRVTKLEAAVADSTGERQQRIAAGLCPDCGYEHGYLPTNGGPWRCVVCGNRFTLQPGLACNQACPVEEQHGCNALQRPRRLGGHTGHTPEQLAWFAKRRMRRAADDLRESMLPEHFSVVHDWVEKHDGDQPIGHPGESWYSILERRRPPALVRAFWLLINHHVATHLSVSLAPDVAQVYLSDPDAWPARPCGGCGYPMPGRVKLRPDSTYDHVGGVRPGACPICGLHNDQEDGG